MAIRIDNDNATAIITGVSGVTLKAKQYVIHYLDGFTRTSPIPAGFVRPQTESELTGVYLPDLIHQLGGDTF